MSISRNNHLSFTSTLDSFVAKLRLDKKKNLDSFLEKHTGFISVYYQQVSLHALFGSTNNSCVIAEILVFSPIAGG